MFFFQHMLSCTRLRLRKIFQCQTCKLFNYILMQIYMGLIKIITNNNHFWFMYLIAMLVV